jgi:hypothetical protein
MFKTISKPTFYSYPLSEFGTSMDIECLKFQLLLLVCDYAFDVAPNFPEPSFSPNGQLPCLIADNEILVSQNIKEKCVKTESVLTISQKATSIAFISYLDSTLKYAIDYELWFEDSSYLSLMGEKYPWPLNYLIPINYRSEKIKNLISNYPFINSININDAAGKLFRRISVFLGDKRYFFGESMTFLDVAVFSYLHFILKILPKFKVKSKLFHMLQDYVNLCNFHQKILSDWF